MAGPCTGAMTVVQTATGIGHAHCFAGKLDVDISISMGGSVARAMTGISRAIGSMTERTGKAAMRAMSSRYIRECRTAWPPAGAGRSVARSATVAGTGLGVASLAIWWCARSNRVHSCDAAVRMATAGDAAGERRRSSCR
jgi:hypothetical protein